ncbi:MAG: HD domain-containing protein [Pirellulales bacterium]|nr:HD domain-containing protein [Pirellulales bacterium]
MSGVQNRRVLVVDDNESIHEDFRKVLGKPERVAAELSRAAAALFGRPARSSVARPVFELSSALQGKDGLECARQAVQRGEPFAVAFVDVRMPPGWDGIETAQRLWTVDPNLQIVICTAHSDYSFEQMLERLGYTDRLLILKKPFDNVEVMQLAIALTRKWELAQQARERVDNLEQTVAAQARDVVDTRDVAVFALAQLAESRDPETGQHLERIRSYCRILADELHVRGPYTDLIDEQFVDDIFRSSPLHDIGKVGIPDAILLKPGRLSEREFAILKKHTLIGAGALERAAAHSGCGGFLQMAADIARYHHERWDGTGYPHGLLAEDIPLAARITALADVFDALTSVRVYKAAYDPEIARVMIEEQGGKHFDPAVVDAFRNRFDEFLSTQAALDAKLQEPELELTA